MRARLAFLARGLDFLAFLLLAPPFLLVRRLVVLRTDLRSKEAIIFLKTASVMTALLLLLLLVERFLVTRLLVAAMFVWSVNLNKEIKNEEYKKFGFILQSTAAEIVLKLLGIRSGVEGSNESAKHALGRL